MGDGEKTKKEKREMEGIGTDEEREEVDERNWNRRRKGGGRWKELGQTKKEKREMEGIGTDEEREEGDGRKLSGQEADGKL
ncbi:hypothetical protein Pcinc_026888 [Petrolisthes cinctipes]|uniref:Uncharacterized protein n=1 Tax=Petrolisthes cinctipes TaxID=88211 RepID=A0AAE1KBM3_PETCI|nr:hypothetical protein Pcinc_026888 [Petrolisthes cinctipes]